MDGDYTYWIEYVAKGLWEAEQWWYWANEYLFIAKGWNNQNHTPRKL